MVNGFVQIVEKQLRQMKMIMMALLKVKVTLYLFPC